MTKHVFLATLCGLAIGVAKWAVGADSTFVYCSEGSPSGFNPQLAADGTTFNASGRTLYNRLVEFEIGGTAILPSLAQSWQISKDGKTYTFHLRPDVPFHTTDAFKPTRPFEADDVIFSFGRMHDKKHPYHAVSGGAYPYFESMAMGQLITAVEKLDAHTVRFHLRRAETPFLANLAMDFASILSAEYAAQLLKAKTPEKIDTEPVGTGPFVFRRYVKDTMIRYEAFSSHFDTPPAISKLVFVITPDASVRLQKLKSGECQLIAEPAPQDLPQIEQLARQKKAQLMAQPGLNIGYLAINVQKKPFDTLEVRQAINHALNRKLYLDAIYQGIAVPAINPIPPTMWSYDAATEAPTYDVALARSLMAKAGWAGGFDTELWTLPVARPYNPNGKKMGELMQADLAKIGIRAKLVTYDWPTYLAKMRSGEHGLMQMGWTGDNGDPDNFLRVLLSCEAIESGANAARWCDKTFDHWIEEALGTRDQKKRAVLYKQAQARFQSQLPWVTLAHATVSRALAPGVSQYKISPFGLEILNRVHWSKP